MKQIGRFTNFIGLEPGVYSMGSPGVEQIASGNPITIQSAAAPFTEMLIFGKTTQNGTPSPENPVALDTAGASGQVNVSVGGANLINANDIIGKVISSNDEFPISISGGTFAASIQTSGGSENGFTASFRSEDDTVIKSVSVRNNAIFELTSEEASKISKVRALYYTGTVGAVLNAIQIERGTVVTPYQPYVTPQTLIVSTPNGLPGVPVYSSQQEYTYIDSEGQKWISNSEEFYSDGTGMFIQRTFKEILDDKSSWKYNTADGGRFVCDLQNKTIGTGREHVLCNRGKFVRPNPSGDKNGYCFVIGKEFYYYTTNYTDLESFMQFISENPIEIIYPLAEPIITPLTAEQVEAFKALTTYEPTTVIQNDAGCWMQVGYYSGPAIQRLVIDAQKINGV